MGNWYTDFLIETILERKRELAFFKQLAVKYPEANKTAYGISQEIRILMGKLIERKKENKNEKLEIPS